MKPLIALLLLCLLATTAPALPGQVAESAGQVAESAGQVAESAGPGSGTTAPYQGWRVLEVGEFRFIYEPSDEAVALEAASYAEEVYEVVTGSLDYYPEDVPVVIRGRTATANGYYTPFPHQLNLFVTSPSGPWLGARGESWIKLLLIHEFTHYCHFANRKGVLGGMSYLFGHDLTAAHGLFYPGWLVEGITVTNESYYSSGGRGTNPFFRMKYEAFLNEKELWSYQKSKFGSAYAPQDRIYVAGYLYVDYLRKTYGEEVMARIHETFARAPILGIPRAVRKVTGVKARELHVRMAAHLQEQYAPETSRRGRERISPVRQGDWYLPLGTEDGWFYYARSHEEAPGIWRARELGGPAERILTVSLTDPYSFDVSGDGGTVLFTSVRPDPGHPAGLSSFSELYRYDLGDLGTEEPVRLTDGVRFQQPAISPTGERAVVTERVGSRFRLLAVNPESGESRVLFDQENTSVKYPVWSPGGERIAFVANTAGEQDLLIAAVRRDEDPSGSSEGKPAWSLGEIRNLTSAWDPPVYFPRFSGPEAILFASDHGPRTELYEADLVSGELLRLLRDPVAAWGAVYADSSESGGPGGRRLIYGSYDTTGSSLWAAPSAPGTEEPIGVISKEVVQAETTEVAATAGQTAAPRPGPDDSSIESQRYRDLPRPLLWFPLAGVVGTLDEVPALSVGTFFLAMSTLQRHQLQGTLFYTPELQQPSLGVSYSFAPGPVSFSYGLSYEYQEEDNLAEAELVNELTAGVPLLRSHGVGESVRLTSSWSVGVENSWLSPRSMSFGELNESAVVTGDQIFLTGGLSLVRSSISAPKAFYGERTEGADLLVRYYPKLLDRRDDLVETVSSVGAVRALPWWHHALGLSVRGGASSRGSGGDLVGPRGGVNWDGGDGGYEILPSFRYLIPLGLWEQRFLGVNFLSGGVSLFAESSFYGDFGGGIAWGEEYYLGTEFDVSMQLFNIVPLVGTAGIVARVDAQKGVDDGWEDIFLYVNASLSIPSVSSRGLWIK
ncbi:MAG: hypothetical protein ACLFQZ_08850 [Spirochaetaceae bacterium]